jgi:glycosyltransferase involved in cell wall biosynthesis
MTRTQANDGLVHYHLSRERTSPVIRCSVIIPVYNGASTIGQAIDSVRAQNVDDYEIVVVDDGSTDRTPGVLRRYQPAVKVIGQDNAGAAAARNAGVTAACGEYLSFLDADDVWHPTRLRKTVAALQGSPQAVLSFCDSEVVDGDGAFVARTRAGRAPSHTDLLQRAWPILPSAVTVTRAAFERVGGFCEEFKGCGGDDPYAWLMLSELGPFEYVAEPLVHYRQGLPATTIEKYAPGRETFVRLVRARYGKAAEGCIRESRDYFAGMFLAGALDEFDRGNPARAAGLMRRAIGYSPFLLFNRTLAQKALSARNARRFFSFLFPSALSRTAFHKTRRSTPQKRSR